MQTVYLETTIVSYYVSRPSRDVVIAARQTLTVEWWDEKRRAYGLCISPAVLREARQGDPAAAARRLELLAAAEVLEPNETIDALGRDIQRALNIPDSKRVDALHIAY